jgi:hypothetical protein
MTSVVLVKLLEQGSCTKPSAQRQLPSWFLNSVPLHSLPAACCVPTTAWYDCFAQVPASNVDTGQQHQGCCSMQQHHSMRVKMIMAEATL